MNVAPYRTLAGKQKTTPWEKKLEQRRKQESIKQREREMKAEKEAEAERYVQTQKQTCSFGPEFQLEPMTDSYLLL